MSEHYETLSPIHKQKHIYFIEPVIRNNQHFQSSYLYQKIIYILYIINVKLRKIQNILNLQ